MNRLLYFVLFLIPISVFSQKRLNPPNRSINQSSYTSIYSDKEFSRKGGISRLVSNDNSIKGSTFLYDTFNNESTILDASGNNYTINNFNIDLKDNSFVSRVTKDTLFYFQNISQVKIGDKVFKKIDGEIYSNLYLGNKISLYEQYSVILKEAVIDKLSYKEIKPKHWLRSRKTVYSLGTTKSFKELKKGKKEILKLLAADKVKAVKAFMKSNSLSYRKEEDIIKLFEYYDSL